MLDENINTLYRLFNIFNDKYFDSKIDKPVISIQSGARKGALGWCTVDKIWKTESKEETYYELNMSPEYFNRTIYEICGTLIHEMVHLYNLKFGVKDTSRGNAYHNKKFKERAEKSGLIISHSERIGWSITKLQQETKEFIDSIEIPKFTLYRDTKVNCLAKQTSYKHTCPTCKAKARTTKVISLICGECSEEMIISE